MSVTRLEQLLLLSVMTVCTLGCGQLGEADFNLGPGPSIGLGDYSRVTTLESPNNQEFSWVSSAPCPDSSLLLLGGNRNDNRSWITTLSDLDTTITWQEVTDILPDLDDAALHCAAHSITIFALQSSHSDTRLGKLWTFSRDTQLSAIPELERTFDISRDASSPSLRVTTDVLDVLYLTSLDEQPTIIGQRLTRDDLAATETLSFELETNESPRDVSIRFMSTTSGEPLSILTAFGKLNGKDTLWMTHQQLAAPTPVDGGESYTSQNFIRWRDSYWLIGTRLRPTVPLGLVFSKEHNTVPTLGEIH